MNIDIFCSDTFKKSAEMILNALRGQSPSLDEKHFVIGPDKLTLSSESEILHALKNKGTFNIEVFSFSRLCSYLLGGKKTYKYLSKSGAVMLLARLLTENATEFKCFVNSHENVSFAEVLYKTISKLKYSRVSADALKVYAATAKNNLKYKLYDVALIYDKYEKFIKDRFYDSSGKLDILYELLDENELIKNSRIYLKDFDNFSKQEFNVISRLILKAKSVSIACTQNSGGVNSHLYSNEIYDEIIKICDRLSLKPNIVRGDATNGAFKTQLKHNLFSYKINKKIAAPPDSLYIYNAADIFEEAERAAREIKRLVLGGKRYLDITVVLGNLQDYSSAVKSVFAKYEIPCFFDETKNLATHPLCRFVVDLLNLKIEGLDGGSVRAFVKNYFFCGADGVEDACKFENYCLLFNIAGSLFLSPFSLGENLKEDAERVRARLADLLFAFKINKSDKAENFVAAVKELLSFADAERTLAAFRELQLSAGMATEAEFSAQAQKKIIDVLEQIESVFGGKYLLDSDFYKLLLSGLSSVEIAVIPMYLDSVFIGELNTSKYHKVKNLFILGCNEGALPKEIKDTELLSEENLAELKSGGVGIEPSIKSINGEERFNVFQLLLEPSERLYVSYASFDIKGAAIKPSRVVGDLCKMFGVYNNDGIIDFPVMDKSDEKFMPQKSFNDGLLSKKAAAQALVGASRAYLDDQIGQKEFYDFGTLYYALKRDRAVADLLNKIDAPKKSEPLLNAKRLFFKSPTTAISKLETYFTCPYKHFLKYGLSLKVREVSKIQSVDIGVILHSVIEKFVSRLDINFSREQSDALSGAALNEVLSGVLYKKLNNNKNQRIIKERIKNEAARVCYNVLQQLKCGKFSPVALEARFDTGAKYPPIALEGTGVLLKGVIDRVDRFENYVRVIDYKTGDVRFDFKDVYAGKKIQLFVYLAAVLEQGLKPAGAYYFPVHNNYTDFSEEDDYLLRGVTADENEAIFAQDATLGVDNLDSKIIPVRLKIDKATGELAVRRTQSDKNLSAEQLRGIIAYVKSLCENAADEILSGNIEISPYHNTCVYCDYVDVCVNFDKEQRIVNDYELY
jgi:ATP-dependent helicase/nuclease subunit B